MKKNCLYLLFLLTITIKIWAFGETDYSYLDDHTIFDSLKITGGIIQDGKYYFKDTFKIENKSVRLPEVTFFDSIIFESERIYVYYEWFKLGLSKNGETLCSLSKDGYSKTLTTSGEYEVYHWYRKFTPTRKVKRELTSDGWVDIIYWEYDRNSPLIRRNFRAEKDNTGPDISYNVSPSSTSNTNVSLSISATDNGVGLQNLEIKVGNRSWTPYTSSLSIPSNVVVQIRATDKLGNPSTKTVNIDYIDKSDPIVEIDKTPGTIWLDQNSYTLTATKCEDIGVSGLKEYYWKVKNGSTWTNKTNKLKTLTVTENTIAKFYALDKAGNDIESDEYNIKFDRDAPTISAPSFSKYIVLSGISYARFYWNKKTSDGGSPVISNLDTPSGTVKRGSYYDIPLSSNFGNEVTFTAHVEDEMGHVGDSKSKTFQLAEKIQIDTTINSKIKEIKENVVNYEIDIPIKSDTNILTIPSNIGYVLTVSNKSDNSIIYKKNITLNEIKNKSLKISIAENGLGGEQIGINIDTSFKEIRNSNPWPLPPNIVTIFTPLYSSSEDKTLPKFGSQPEIAVGKKDFYLEEPSISFREKYSKLGLDIDSNFIRYELWIKEPNSLYVKDKIINIERPGSLNSIEFNIRNDLFNSSGEYKIQVRSSDGNMSNEITLSYDNLDPNKPVIKYYKNNNEINIYNSEIVDIKLSNLTDNGVAGLDKVEIYDNNNELVTSYTFTDSDTQEKTLSNVEIGSIANNSEESVSLYAKLYDKAGNTSDSQLTTIVIDKISPTLTKLEPILGEKDITFKWSSLDQHSFRIGNNGNFTLGTTNYHTVSSLQGDTLSSIEVFVKDEAGNTSSLILSGRTLDVFDVITKDNFTTKRDGENRYIEFTFSTTKPSRYIVTETTSNTILNQTYTNGISKYKFEYNEIKEFNFNFKLKNQSNNINTNFTDIKYEPINFAPVFSDSIIVTPVNGNYFSKAGKLTWDIATDIDGDPLNYTVYINNSTESWVSSKLSTNSVLISNIIDRDIRHNEKFTWSVEVTDGISNDTTSDYDFTIDDLDPKLVDHNLYNESGYTNSLYYIIEDGHSGIKSVEVTNGNKTLTPIVTQNQNKYEIDLSELGTHGEFSDIVVKVIDNVGNDFTHYQEIIKVDNIKPEITKELTTTLLSGSNLYLSNKNQFQIKLTTKDNYSGIKDVYYLFKDINSVSPSDKWQPLTTASNSNLFSTDETSRDITLDWTFTDGVKKYLFIKVLDDSGRFSTHRMLNYPIYTDVTPPKYVKDSLKVSGYKEVSLKNYIWDISKLIIDCGFVDNNQKNKYINLLNKEYIIEGDSELVLKSKGKTAYNNVTITENVEYNLYIKAYNDTNKFKKKKILSFKYDKNTPYNPKITLNRNDSFISDEDLQITLSANDLGSGIEKALLKIGSTLDGTELVETKLEGWSYSNSKAEKNYSFRLPKTLTDGTYYISCEFIDFVGKSITARKTFEIDNNSPQLRINSLDYTQFKNNNTFDWSFNYPDNIVTARYKLGHEDWVLISKQDYFKDIVISKSLIHGDELDLSIEVTTQGLDKSYHKESKNILYDESAPVDKGSNQDVFNRYIDTNQLSTTWDIEDLESGIKSISHSVDQLLYDNEEEKYVWKKIIPETDVDPLVLKGRVNFNKGSNKGDKFIITRKVINNAGRVSTRISPIIEVDDDVPLILTNIEDNANFLKPTATPSVSWYKTETDNDSGMTYYYYFSKEIHDYEEVKSWTLGSDDKGAVINVNDLAIKPKHGETWYFYIKGVNGSKIPTYGSSNGIIFDNEAPDNISVKVTSSGSSYHTHYLTNQTDLKVEVNSYENTNSKVTYNVDYGTFVDKNYVLKSVANKFNGESKQYNLEIEDINKIKSSNDSIYFRADATDEATNIDLDKQGFSYGIIYDNKKPEVKNVEYDITYGTFNAYWKSTQGNSPIKNYSVTLENSSGIEVDIPGNSSGVVKGRSINFDVKSIPSGKYNLYIKAVSESKLESDTAFLKEILIDSDEPKITKIYNPPTFVYKTLAVKTNITEVGSTINKYRYSIGNSTNENLLTGSLQSVDTSLSSGEHSFTIDLYSFSEGYSKLKSGDELYLYIQYKDEAENWSKVEKSKPFILDKSLAENVSIDHSYDNNLTNVSNKISGLTFTAKDSISGIKEITINLYKVINGVNSFVGKDVITYNSNEVSETEHSFDLTSKVMDDTGVYRVGIVVKNGTNESTNEVLSIEDFVVDTTPPSLTFDNKSWVFNDNLTEVNYTRSEESKVTFYLYKESIIDYINSDVISNGEPFTFDHEYTEESNAYGYYQVKAELVDVAGNTNSYNLDSTNLVQRIRFNEPPHIVFKEEYKTTPGKPFKVSLLKVYDVDDVDSTLKYSWKFLTDNNSSISQSSDKTPEVEFFHSSTKNEVTEYEIEVTVTDEYDKSRKDKTKILVLNTKEGTLYTNEYWRNTHNILEDIIVPNGITLTINNDTKVYIVKDKSLTVFGNLNASSGTVFSSMGLDKWNGIIIENTGNASIDDTTVTGAKRGISIFDNGILTLSNSTISGNKTGLHIYDSSPKIINSIITNNYAYGIKEDGEDPKPDIDQLSQINSNTINHYKKEEAFEPGEIE